MRHTENIEVDDTTYEFTHLPATTAYKMQLRLVALFGESLGAAISGLDLKAGIKKSNINVQQVLGVLGNKIDDPEVMGLVKDLMVNIRFQNQDLAKIFDTHFAGRIGHMWKVVIAQVKFQFRDFFEDLVGLLSEGAARISASQTTSSGPAGD